MTSDSLLSPIDPVKALDRKLLELERRGPVLDVINEALRRRGVLIEEVLSDARDPHILRTRYEIWWALHDDLGWSRASIARLWDTEQTTVGDGIAIVGADLGLAEYAQRAQRNRRAA